jgi:hypothetical protein
VRSGALGVAHGHFVNSHAVPFAEQNFPSLGEAELKAGAQWLSAVQGASSCGYGFQHCIPRPTWRGSVHAVAREDLRVLAGTENRIKL